MCQLELEILELSGGFTEVGQRCVIEILGCNCDV